MGWGLAGGCYMPLTATERSHEGKDAWVVTHDSIWGLLKENYSGNRIRFCVYSYGIVAFLIPVPDLFKYNFSLLALLVIVRMVKQLIKDKKIVIKRPNEWSILKKKDC